jgi:2-methylcitrate dehydratase PrpD
MDPLDDIAGRIVAVRAEGVSSEDLRAARTCVAHHIACALAARELPWCRVVEPLATDDPRGATLLGTERVVRTEDAALVNAVLGQSTLAEDLHVPSLVHPGSVVVSTAMALAEQNNLSGAELLAAVVVGYEVAGTLGAAMKTVEFTARGFRPSGVFGPLGAAAAAAHLLRLDAAATVSALAIAANMASGLREWAHAGSTDVYVQNGLAARNGLLAARLAAAGITGPPSALTGPAGMANAYSGGADFTAALPFAGIPVVRQVQFKRHPTCSAVQTVAQLALSVRQPGLIPEIIDSVVVHTHRHGTTNPGCDNPGPFDGVGQAQMSNQLTVALALTRGRLSVADYLDHGSVLDLARRVAIVEDPRYTRDYPRVSRARIKVECTDGRVLAGELDDTDPLTPPEVDQNLRRVLEAGCRQVDPAAVLRLLDELASMPSVPILAAAMRGAGSTTGAGALAR